MAEAAAMTIPARLAAETAAAGTPQYPASVRRVAMLRCIGRAGAAR